MKEKIFLMMGVCAMALTSCSDDEDIITNTDSDKVAVNVISTLNPYSRAVNSVWDANDQIGLSCSGMMTNKPYVTKSGDGVFNAVGDPDYYMDAADHTFTAYYPYQADMKNSSFDFKVSSVATEEGQKNNDCLWATGTGCARKPGITMNFEHKMTRVIFNVTTDENDGFYADDIFGNVEGSSIVSSQGILNAAYVSGTFNTALGIVSSNDFRTPFYMTGSDLTDTHVRQYVLILPEQVSCNYKHIFNEGKSNAQTFFAQLDSKTWKAGYTYTYNIVIGRTGAYVAKSTITEWTDGGSLDSNCQPA
jgi:hypothetical protein